MNTLIQKIRETLHLSYSQIRTFLSCPQRYFYQYVVGLEWAATPSVMVLGSAVHRAVAKFYRILKESGERIPVEAMHEELEEHIAEESAGGRISFKPGESRESLVECGNGLITEFHDAITPQRIVAVEEPFLVKIPGSEYALAGVFDLIETDGSVPVLVELKTSAKSWSERDVREDLQSAVYTYAMREMGYESGVVRFDILVKNKKPTFQQISVAKDSGDIARMLSVLHGVTDAIEKGAFFRNPSWQCRDCPFHRTCENLTERR